MCSFPPLRKGRVWSVCWFTDHSLLIRGHRGRGRHQLACLFKGLSETVSMVFTACYAHMCKGCTKRTEIMSMQQTKFWRPRLEVTITESYYLLTIRSDQSRETETYSNFRLEHFNAHVDSWSFQPSQVKKQQQIKLMYWHFRQTNTFFFIEKL